MLNIEPHPDKVLIKTTQKDYEELFYKMIKRDDGSLVRLFTQIEHEEGYEARFQQNLSTGRVIAVGENVKGIFPSDLAILDYLVLNDQDSLVGIIGGDRTVSLLAHTTYHKEDALPSITMRKAHIKGDYDTMSKILGLLRHDKLISLDPYIFLTKEESVIVKVNAMGIEYQEEQFIVERTVLAAFEGSGYKEGDKVLIKEPDLFFRRINGKEISVCFCKEILGKR